MMLARFGRAPLVLAGLFFLSGGYLVFTRCAGKGEKSTRTPQKSLTLWLFEKNHYQEYQARKGSFVADRDCRVIIETPTGLEAHHDKLRNALETGRGAPDLAEIEIRWAGVFFARGRPRLRDLTPYIKRDGLEARLVPHRWAPWSYQGKTYGVPHDLHPVVLLYRKDLYDQAGVDPVKLETWEDFVAAWKDRPGGGFAPLFLPRQAAPQFMLLLWQAGGDIFDGRGGVVLDREPAPTVLAFYRDLFLKHRLCATMSVKAGLDKTDYEALKAGRAAAVLAPDWYIGVLKDRAPELAGKFRAAPLPAWKKGGRRTSTWGGTMIGITTYCPDPELAWALIKHLYLAPESPRVRYEKTRIIVPDKTAWDDPVYHQPDHFVGGQVLGELLCALAESIPPVQPDPRLGEARAELNGALYRVIEAGQAPAAALREVAEKLRQGSPGKKGR